MLSDFAPTSQRLPGRPQSGRLSEPSSPTGPLSGRGGQPRSESAAAAANDMETAVSDRGGLGCDFLRVRRSSSSTVHHDRIMMHHASLGTVHTADHTASELPVVTGTGPGAASTTPVMTSKSKTGSVGHLCGLTRLP
jgi:hypothetical protein